MSVVAVVVVVVDVVVVDGDVSRYHQVEEGEEMDISCTATDGNPLPKVFTHHHHHHSHSPNHENIIIIVIINQVTLSLDGTELGSSSLSFTTNLVAYNHHHDQEIVCEVCHVGNGGGGDYDSDDQV